MKMKLKINKKARSCDEITRWRVTQKGLANYYSLTEKYAEHIIEMAQDEETSVEEVVDEVYAIIERCKEEAFEKSTKTRKKWKEIDDEVELNSYSKQLNREMMKDRLKYKYNAKLRTYAARKRRLLERRGEAPFALQREDGTKAVTYEERAETLAEYNRKLLGRNVHPGEENEEFEKRKEIVREYMERNEVTSLESEISIEDYMWAVDRIAQKKKPMFNDFLRSHPAMKASLYWIVRRMYQEETIPERFLETELIPLFKNKGSPADPGGYRYLHLKSWGARLTEMCIFKKVEKLFDTKTPAVQLGGMKERSTLYHLLTVNETARRAFNEGGGIVVTLVDCQKMFDCVHLDDIAYEMVVEKLDPKALRNLYKFSYVNVLHVQGARDQWFIIPGGVGQGSISGARGCSFLVAKRLDRQVEDHPDPLMYADVNLTGQAFVDDVIGCDKDAKGCRITSDIFSKILNTMGLKAHDKKSVVIVCGTNKYIINTKLELNEEKAKIQGHELSVVEEDAYLGIMMCQGSPSAQVTCNINMKRRKVASKLNELLATLRKDGVKMTGYLNSALTLVEGVIRPSMCYGMETLVTFNKGQTRTFNQIWKKAIAKMLNIPDNVTTAALFLVLNVLPIYAYVLYFKMLLIQSIFQRKNSRIYNILRDQYVSEDTGCMVEDVLKICKSYDLPDIIAGPVTKEYIRDKVFEKETEKLTRENNEVKSLPFHRFTLDQDMSHLQYPKKQARAYLCYRLGLLQWATRRRKDNMEKYGTVECPCRTPRCVQEEAEDCLDHAKICDGYYSKFSEKSHDPKWELSNFLVALSEERSRRWPWLPDLIVYPESKQTPELTACDTRSKEDVNKGKEADQDVRINMNNNNNKNVVNSSEGNEKVAVAEKEESTKITRGCDNGDVKLPGQGQMQCSHESSQGVTLTQCSSTAAEVAAELKISSAIEPVLNLGQGQTHPSQLSVEVLPGEDIDTEKRGNKSTVIYEDERARTCNGSRSLDSLETKHGEIIYMYRHGQDAAVRGGDAAATLTAGVQQRPFGGKYLNQCTDNKEKHHRDPLKTVYHVLPEKLHLPGSQCRRGEAVSDNVPAAHDGLPRVPGEVDDPEAEDLQEGVCVHVQVRGRGRGGGSGPEERSAVGGRDGPDTVLLHHGGLPEGGEGSDPEAPAQEDQHVQPARCHKLAGSEEHPAGARRGYGHELGRIHQRDDQQHPDQVGRHVPEQDRVEDHLRRLPQLAPHLDQLHQGLGGPRQDAVPDDQRHGDEGDGLEELEAEGCSKSRGGQKEKDVVRPENSQIKNLHNILDVAERDEGSSEAEKQQEELRKFAVELVLELVHGVGDQESCLQPRGLGLGGGEQHGEVAGGDCEPGSGGAVRLEAQDLHLLQKHSQNKYRNKNDPMTLFVISRAKECNSITLALKHPRCLN